MTYLDDHTGDDDQLLEVAGRLLSSLGYDAVTTEMIADAAGVDVATLTERYEGKRGIFMAVLRRAHRRRNEGLSEVEAVFTPDYGGLTRLLDAYLDMSMDNPELGAFWMQRWLSDADDITQLDAMFSGPTSAE